MSWTDVWVDIKKFANKTLEKVSVKNLLIILSIIIGIVCAILAIILKVVAHKIGYFLKYSFEKEYQNYLFFFYPLAGIVLTLLYIRIFRKGVFVKGLSSLIFSIYKQSGILPFHKTYSHMMTSAVTVGFGGSVGLEAPIVITGSAVGSNIAKAFKLGHKEKILMLACGASAGIAAIFNCPIAAVIFSFEVLLSEVKVPAFIPLIISSATATVVSKLLYGGQLFILVTKGWDINALPYYILLGVICGLVSAYMININSHIEHIFKSINNTFKKAIGGGLILGLLIFIFPPLFGEGYEIIQELLQGKSDILFSNGLFYGLKNEWLSLLFVALLIVIKIIASALTIGSGGNGGIFAPSLFTGAITGYFVARFINLTGLISLNETNFVAVGMAGILSGVVHAPLTGIFLIAEITGGYVLFVPLMIVSASSYFIGKYFEPYSVYTKELARKGKWNSNNRDSFILNKIKISRLLEKDFIPVDVEDNLGKLVEAIATSKRNIFPVIDKDRKLVGIILLDNIREIMFRTELYNSVDIKDLMFAAPSTINLNDSIEHVVYKFEQYDAWNLPVVNNGRYIGFISKSRIFSLYRKLLVEHSKEIF